MTKPVKPSENVKSNSTKISQTKKDSEIISIEDKFEALNQDLIKSERRALGLFELTNDAIFIINMNGEYADLNQRAAELLGYNRHDMIGRSLFDFIVDSELESSKKKLEDLIAGRILPIYERRFKRRDGSTFPAEINAAIVQNEDGNPAYIQSAMRDITERVEAEETLERERKAFHLIAESTIYATNLADLCQRIAEGLAKILDFDSATMRLYDPDTRLLTPVAFIDYSKEVSTEDIVPQSIDNHNFVFALAARNKRAIVSPRFEDRALLAPFQDRMLKLGIFALITWPILDANEDLLGVVQLVSHKPKEIPEEDMLFFETIARMFTVALERKSAEEALKESEEKYRSFAQKFQGIAYRIKMDWTPIFYNGAVEEITGYTEEELKSWNPRWEDITHTDDIHILKENKHQLQTIPNYAIEIEYRIIRKDGKIRWVHEVCQNICDVNYKPIYIQGAIYDISERKRSEHSQRIQYDLGISLSSISDLKLALETVLEAVCLIDVIECGVIYLVDKETGFLRVIAQHELSSKFVEKISYYSTESPFTKAILTGNPIYCDYYELSASVENKLILKEGLHAIANIPIYSESRIFAMLLIGSNSSDTIPMSTRSSLEVIASQIEGSIARIGAEEALRESDEKYRSFVQNFQGIAYRLTANFEPVFLDGAIFEMTGYTTAELLAKKLARNEVIHPYDIDGLEKKLEQSIKDPTKIGRYEYRIITKDGKIKWVQDIWQVVMSNNEAIGFQGSMYNITDRKVAQSELQTLYEDLEQRVEERTEQLTATNKELTAFSYSVSHDLRTPLRHIGGFAQLLEKRVSSAEDVDARILSYTQRIIDSVDEMNKLIDGLLTFSRMSRVDMVKIRINLTELVQDVLNDFQVEMGNREIDVRFNFLPDVIGDPSLLRLVLVNIVANALKFTKTRDIAEIEIGTKPAKDSDKVTIYLSDNGVGFDMQYYDKLFGVFQRLHKNEKFEGTGIGLATVQRVIRRMGGTIWAEGEIDKGATFYFTIHKATDLDE